MTTANLGAGPFSGTITVAAAGATNSPQRVAVNLEMVAPPPPETVPPLIPVNVPTGPGADLALTNSFTDPAVPGQDLVFQLQVTNRGPSDATGVSITDSFSPGFNVNSASFSQGSFNRATGIWSVGSLAADTSATLSVTVPIDTDAVGSLTNTARIASTNEPDPDEANNEFSETIAIKPLEGVFEALRLPKEIYAFAGEIGIASVAVGLAGLVFTLSTTINEGGRWAIKVILSLKPRKKETQKGTRLSVQPSFSVSQTFLGTLWGLLLGGGSLFLLQETLSSPPSVELAFEMVVPLTLVSILISQIRLVRRA